MQENTPTLFFEINHLNFVFIVGLYDDTQDLKIIEKIITAKEDFYKVKTDFEKKVDVFEYSGVGLSLFSMNY